MMKDLLSFPLPQLLKLKSCEVGKSEGPYSIPIKLSKILSSYILHPSSEIVNKSFSTGVFPIS